MAMRNRIVTALVAAGLFSRRRRPLRRSCPRSFPLRASRPAIRKTRSSFPKSTRRSCERTRSPGRCCGWSHRLPWTCAATPTTPWAAARRSASSTRRRATGQSPKFECVFEGGEVLKVKYGSSPEVHTEVAATRLMHALGAGADRMYLVDTAALLRLPGRPAPDAAAASRARSRSASESASQIVRGQDADREARRSTSTTRSTSTSRPSPSSDAPRAGRSRRTERPAGAATSSTSCQPGRGEVPRRARRAAPARGVPQQLGQPRRQPAPAVPRRRRAPGGRRLPRRRSPTCTTWGRPSATWAEPRASASSTWRAGGPSPIWKDRAACTVSIESPRFHGATFGEATISERGRQFLAERLRRIGDEQVRDLFEGARFAEYEDASACEPRRRAAGSRRSRTRSARSRRATHARRPDAPWYLQEATIE